MKARTPQKPAPAGRGNPSKEFRERLEAQKEASTLQLLFKAARLLDEEALRRVAHEKDALRLRRSHTALLPHIDLGGTRVSVLAERLGISKQAVSELIDELESAGVLRRTPDPIDARARLVSFTPRGLDGLLEGVAVLRQLEAEIARSIGASTMQGLRVALLRILSDWEPKTSDQRT
jgi:DNA-binding MarR family transcriptional regulator